MLGTYKNFPANVHFTETYTSTLSIQKLQEKIAATFQEVNRRNFSFEDVAIPTMPDCTVIFELGIADEEAFCYLTEEEAKRLRKALDEKQLKVLDWFCGIRYYKNGKEKKTPLKFDYYMLRFGFGEKNALELQVFHERGPRYISPEDLAVFIERRVNQTSNRKILKRTLERTS